jgi:hypothetical protein
MYEKFLKIKEDKPWLFYVLIIPFVIVAILEFYNKYLVNSGKNIVKEAEEENKQLNKQQMKAEAGADYHKEKAEKIEQEIQEKKVDKNWHLH